MLEASPGEECDPRESVGKSCVGLCAGVACPESLLRQWAQGTGDCVPHGEGFPVSVVGAQEGGVLTLSIKQHVFCFHDRTVKTCVP